MIPYTLHFYIHNILRINMLPLLHLNSIILIVCWLPLVLVQTLAFSYYMFVHALCVRYSCSNIDVEDTLLLNMISIYVYKNKFISSNFIVFIQMLCLLELDGYVVASYLESILWLCSWLVKYCVSFPVCFRVSVYATRWSQQHIGISR